MHKSWLAGRAMFGGVDQSNSSVSIDNARGRDRLFLLTYVHCAVSHVTLHSDWHKMRPRFLVRLGSEGQSKCHDQSAFCFVTMEGRT